MDVAGAHLDDEEHIDVVQGDRAVDMEEITRQHGGRPRAQELPPGAAAARRRGRDPQPFQHAPYRGGADSDAESEQFTLCPVLEPHRISRGAAYPAVSSSTGTGAMMSMVGK